MLQKAINAGGWLVLFYAVPSRPVGARMRLWRRLQRAGALPLKSAVYVLPRTEEHYELCQWLVSEVKAMGGDGAFIAAERIETMGNEEIIAQFRREREAAYREVEKRLDAIERRLASARKGGQAERKLAEELARVQREYAEQQRADFFSSALGRELGARLRRAEAEAKRLFTERKAAPARAAAIPLRDRRSYQGRVWVTRRHPFVDRMASAWLIRKFIDPAAKFDFRDEDAVASLSGGVVSFDARGADFTHSGNLCTFEVLLRAFGIRDRAAAKIARLVHELDLKDGKYHGPEAQGVEEILLGIRKSARDDAEALARAIEVFEMLHASKS
jgi:hypothetical protein